MTAYRLVLAGPSILALAMAAPAHARVPHSDDVIARACLGRQAPQVTPVRLGESLLIESGTIPSEFVADLTSLPQRYGSPLPAKTARQVYSEALIERLGQIENGSAGDAVDPEGKIRATIDTLKERLKKDQPSSAAPLRMSVLKDPNQAWLFQSESPDWSMTCKPGKPEPTVIGQMEDHTPPPLVSVREKPEELPLLGDQRRTAGAFKLSGERERKANDDGSHKTDSKLSVSGTAGLRITSASSSATTSYFFAQYEAERSRTTPAPTLAAGKHQSDGDTNVLEAGVLLSSQLMPNRGKFKLYLDAQAGAVFDFANRSNRLKVSALLRPLGDLRLGLCGLEQYQEIVPSIHLKARCSAGLDVEGSRLLRRGASPLAASDTFLAAGPKLGFEAYLPSAKGMDLIGRVDYRILPILSGKLHRIERLETTIKYRFWTASSIGVDIGFTYADGTNDLSFADEHKLTFGVGIIY